MSSATSNNTPNTIALRDGLGNLSLGTLTLTSLSSTGIVHNSSAGVLSTSLIVNADVDPNAAIVDTKLATITTPNKVANSSTSATSSANANTIVLRDASGNTNINRLTLTNDTLQLVLGTTNPYTITKATTTTSSTLTIPALGASTTEFLIASTASSSYIPMFRQPSVTTTASATITAAMLATGVIITSNTSINLPLGTAIAAEAAFVGFNVTNAIFQVLFVSTINGNSTITGATGTTLVGGNRLYGQASRMLYFRNTGASTWSVY